MREEITSLQAVKSRLQLRITQLEEDLKKTKEELEKKSQEAQAEGEVSHSYVLVSGLFLVLLN